MVPRVDEKGTTLLVSVTTLLFYFPKELLVFQAVYVVKADLISSLTSSGVVILELSAHVQKTN